jgi:hypothetical protein
MLDGKFTNWTTIRRKQTNNENDLEFIEKKRNTIEEKL